MKYIVALHILFLIGCNPIEAQVVEVKHYGALKTIVHQADISAKVNLQTLEEQPHLYALGALENLKGEILILNGEAYVSKVNENKLTVDPSYDHRASLLVTSQIASWTEYTIPESVKSQEQLEIVIIQTAQKAGLDTAKPFPFLIEGTAMSIEWHVIDWPEGDTIHNHQKHLNSGIQGTLEDSDVTILGFHSTHHHRIFTHHSTNVHMHVKSAHVIGHVDGLTLGKDMVLKLPET